MNAKPTLTTHHVTTLAIVLCGNQMRVVVPQDINCAHLDHLRATLVYKEEKLDAGNRITFIL